MNPLERTLHDSYEEIDNLSYLDLCIVVGRMRDVNPQVMAQTLRITTSGLHGILAQPHMRRWEFIKAIINA